MNSERTVPQDSVGGIVGRDEGVGKDAQPLQLNERAPELSSTHDVVFPQRLQSLATSSTLSNISSENADGV